MDILELTIRPTFESLTGGYDETENDNAILYEQGLNSEPLNVEIDEVFVIENGMEAMVYSPENAWIYRGDLFDPDSIEKLSVGKYQYKGKGKICPL